MPQHSCHCVNIMCGSCQVVVCIVADGRTKVHPRVLDCLTLLGVYQPGAYMQKEVNHEPTTAHLFEYTTSFGLDQDLHFKYPDKGIVPTQIIFCMKAKNQKKINSHRWFFNAFAPLLQVSRLPELINHELALRCMYSRMFAYSWTSGHDRDRRVYITCGRPLT